MINTYDQMIHQSEFYTKQFEKFILMYSITFSFKKVNFFCTPNAPFIWFSHDSFVIPMVFVNKWAK